MHRAVGRTTATAVCVAQATVLAEQRVVASIDDVVPAQLGVAVRVAAFVTTQVAAVVTELTRVGRAVGGREWHAWELCNRPCGGERGREGGDGEELCEAHGSSAEGDRGARGHGLQGPNTCLRSAVHKGVTPLPARR